MEWTIFEGMRYDLGKRTRKNEGMYERLKPETNTSVKEVREEGREKIKEKDGEEDKVKNGVLGVSEYEWRGERESWKGAITSAQKKNKKNGRV